MTKVPSMAQLEKMQPRDAEAVFDSIELEIERALSVTDDPRSVRNLKAQMKRLQKRREEYNG